MPGVADSFFTPLYQDEETKLLKKIGNFFFNIDLLFFRFDN